MSHPTYTIVKLSDGTRYYRGALRARADQQNAPIIWECEHEHYARSAYSGGARWCAENEAARRLAQPPAPAEQEAG